MQENYNSFTLHVSTNNLNKEASSEIMAKSIADLATTLEGDSRDVSVSNVIVLTDNLNLNDKGCKVNAHLTDTCNEKKLNLINHSKKKSKNETKSPKSR